MIKAAVKWGLRQLLRNGKISRYLEQQLSTAILSLPQIRFVPPGHFYSPLPDLKDVESDLERLYRRDRPAAVDLNEARQYEVLKQLLSYYPTFAWTEEPKEGNRYWLRNEYFGWGDAVILFGIIQRVSPHRVIEVGSGFSSALMLDTNNVFCNDRMKLTFIEPFPHRLRQLMKRGDKEFTKVIEQPVQKVPLSIFDELEPNDILFIDSSHVSKIGSDLNYILFEILPKLQKGVLVHFHDVFYPFEYPLEWIREGRAWNEAYLLRAFLQYNQAFEIFMFNSYIGYCFPDYIAAHAPLMAKKHGSSLWLRKIE